MINRWVQNGKNGVGKNGVGKKGVGKKGVGKKKMLVKTVLVEAATGKFIIGLLVKQSRIHGYPSRVRMGKDSI